MKNFNKLILGSVGVLASVAITPIVIVSCSSKFSINQLDLKQKKIDVESNYVNNNNGILDYASLQANELKDNVLIYYNAWDGVMHRMSQFTSLLKILEQNPEKIIYVLSNYKEDTGNKNYKLITEKYSNVVFKQIGSDSADIKTWSNQEIADIKIKNPNKKLDLIAPDQLWIQNFQSILENIKNQNLNNAKITFEKYEELMNFNSVTLVSDGSAEKEYLSNDLYDFYSYTKNIFDSETKSWKSSLSLKEQYLKDKNSVELTLENIALLWQSIVSNDENNLSSKSTSQNKFFFASVNIIENANNEETTLLTYNNNESYSGKWFDPFYSNNIQLLAIYKSLMPEDKTLFLEAINPGQEFDLSLLETMNNKINIVYSGDLIFNNGQSTSDSIVKAEKEAKKILFLMNKTMEDKESQNISDFQFFFKGHPRDKEEENLNFKEYILRYVNENKKDYENLKNVEANTWLKFFNKNIPLEFYYLEGYLDNVEENKRNISFYTSYSTILHLLQAENSLDIVKGILTSEDQKKNVFDKYYGESSKIIDYNILLEL